MRKKLVILLFLILLSFPIVLSVEEQDCGKECANQHSEYGDKDQEKSGEPSESDIQAICAQETNWPPSCSFIPDEKGRDLCIKCKELTKEEEGGTFAYEEVQDMCNQEWPSNCSSIPDERKRDTCGKCKTFLAKENDTFVAGENKEDMVEEAEDEEMAEEGFFARIVRFFRELF